MLTKDWIDAGRAAAERAERESCETCGTPKVVGYSNLGVPMAICPTCSPSLAANGKRAVGDVFGIGEER